MIVIWNWLRNQDFNFWQDIQVPLHLPKLVFFVLKFSSLLNFFKIFHYELLLCSGNCRAKSRRSHQIKLMAVKLLSQTHFYQIHWILHQLSIQTSDWRSFLVLYSHLSLCKSHLNSTFSWTDARASRIRQTSAVCCNVEFLIGVEYLPIEDIHHHRQEFLR